jgi:hypothetical protein
VAVVVERNDFPVCGGNGCQLQPDFRDLPPVVGLGEVVCILQGMGIRNYLIEGLSGTGKTSVCNELQRRGYHAIHGDRELAYQGDPETGEPTESLAHEHHIWHVEELKAVVANQDEALTFFCGGSRNFAEFIHLFDDVFVLEVDLDTLNRRLDERPDSEWGGGKPTERELIARLHRTKEDIPKYGISIDATAPIPHVVDEIVRRAKQIDSRAVRHLDATLESRGAIPRMSEMPPWE